MFRNRFILVDFYFLAEFELLEAAVRLDVDLHQVRLRLDRLRGRQKSGILAAVDGGAGSFLGG